MSQIESLQEFLDAVLFFAMKPEYAAQVERAGEQFTQALADETLMNSEYGFNQWLIHNYRTEAGETFITRYLKAVPDEETAALGKMASRSILSVFQIHRTQHNTLLKDALTRKDYILGNQELAEALDDTALHLLRIYPQGASWLAVSEGPVFESSFRDALNRGMMEKFSEYCRINGPQDLEKFIYDNPIMVYKFAEIIESLEITETVVEEEYTVYQSVYLLRDTRAVAAQVAALPGVESGLEEDGIWVFRLPVVDAPEQQLAELVLTDNRMEVECTSAQDLAASRKLLEANVEGIVHLKDEVLDIDSLLGE